ncbi:MAG TPA: bifunctional folylpolyglutamate synthase/dihydrofolate synthase [Planctomycetaceae bacterium]|nr:bifunctional folylpolyglutamate synthase/dihydrofolate synthase [Planctomycetaceae bacterium]
MDMTELVNIRSPAERYKAAVRYLMGRINYERMASVPYRKCHFRLDRMRQLLARLDNPHHRLNAVHIAGTKGKGSTAAMLGQVLPAAGYRTGVYTSPHLDRLEERMAIDGKPCSPDDLVALVERVMPVVEAMDREAAQRGPESTGPTYFEVTTAMALLHFARCRVDLAVLEVGLGGRLDSTNVCQPVVSVITSISLDHTRQLGDALESIAWEKAGIVKPGVPVVSGVADDPARRVIRAVCSQRAAPLEELGRDFSFHYRPPRRLESAPAAGRLDFSWIDGRKRGYQGLQLGLLGRHQAANAAVALATLAQLERAGWPVAEQAVRHGLAEPAWPARIELVGRRPAVLIDGAHNVASVEALINVLQESFSVQRRILVFATTQEKDAQGMLARLIGHFDEIFFTRYLDNPRAVPPRQLAAVAKQISGRRFPVLDEPAAAWHRASQLASAEDLICVAGSFFIAAEIRRLIGQKPDRGPNQATRDG